MNENKDDREMSGNEIVVTGMSGAFPNSDNVLDFMDNLYNKVDMVTDEPRWTKSDPEIPKHVGRTSGIEKFDSQFFKVGHQQSLVLEPMCRKILEHAYGAIFDSGHTRSSLKGKVIGVFVGSSLADFCGNQFFEIKQNNTFAVVGFSKSMLANRVSYWVDGNGPSFNMDSMCASSSAALEKAYNSIKSGECDAAIVGGSNLLLHPIASFNMKRYGLLCTDGKTKCFDKNADGYVRSEAISVIFLQKAKDAKRIYAEIYHTKGSFKLDTDLKFLPILKSKEIQEFIKNVYSETNIDPKQIEYVEANGAAIAEADENEIDAIAKVFAAGKTIKIGSVKSNMGHSEAASGMSALTKLCIAYHKGKLPANLHYKNPQEISAIKQGNVEVLTENTRFDREFTAFNNFSIAGANYHVVLKGHYKEKNLDKYKTKIPRMVLASGRQESSVKKIFDELKKKPSDAEEIGLLHDIFGNDIVGHMGRGYTILDTNEKNETVSISEGVDYYSGLRRPLWFVYSGVGSQWAGMGRDLMRIPTFASTIERCHKVLLPKGLDLIKIITDPDKKIFDQILNAFVGITSIQVALTEVLKEMGIVPDNIIGHSLGELACAYQDGTMTVEEVILTTYSRGIAVLESDLKPGLMAAVGVGYQDLKHICPPEIDMACHNSSESTTISGPVDSVRNFVGELTKKGIFAKEVPSAGTAYHSRYVADAGPKLLKLLKEILKEPKPRSEKWISTSVPKENWDLVTAKYSSAEYHTNNMLNPVLFEEMITMIPENAVVIEIAPHGLLQAILKRSHVGCTHIPLTRRGDKEGVKFLLSAIGKLYITGFNPKIESLYPKIEYPVSTETPLLSHLVEWEHSTDWPLLKLENYEKITSISRNVVFSVHDDEYKYIQDHVINGINVLSESAIITFVWETLAMYNGKAYRDMSVIFKDIHFHSDIIVESETPIRLSVVISKGNNKFEVIQDDRLIASGVVSAAKVIKFRHGIDKDEDYYNDFEKSIQLNSDDVYQVFNSRGYSYRSKFQTIQSSNLERNKALIHWSNDWIPFIDGLLQLNVLSRNVVGVSKPKFIRKLRINVIEQEIFIQNANREVAEFKAQLHKTYGVTRCAGVEIEDITFIDQPIKEKGLGVMKSRDFYPFNNMENIEMKTALEVNFQILVENVNKIIKVINIVDSEVAGIINKVIGKAPTNIEIQNIKDPNTDFVNNVFKSQDSNKTNIIVLENLLQDEMKMKTLQNLISNDTYIMTLENEIPKQNVKEYFSMITSMSDGKKILIMMKKVTLKTTEEVSYIPIPLDKSFSWVPKVFSEIEMSKRVILVSERQPYCGLLGLVKKLKTYGYKNVSAIVTDDFHAPKFDPENGLFKEQIAKNLTINVLRKGQWGGFYYTSANKSANVRNIILKSLVPGDLDKLTWIETRKTSAEKNFVQVNLEPSVLLLFDDKNEDFSNLIEIIVNLESKVFYAGLCTKDCEKATSVTQDTDLGFGMDYSGIDKIGEKIMGLVSGGSLASSVEVDKDLLWPVPEHWTLEDAATVPLPYIYAYYALIIRGRLEKYRSVYINGGSDAFCQAVTSICMGLQCPVFINVENEKTKKMLLQLYPGLNENHISYFNDDSMHQTILDVTHKQGCNVVINSATGYSREAAFKYVSKFGFFLDLSHDMEERKQLNMALLNLDRSYIIVDFSSIFKPENQYERKVLQKLLQEGIESGIVKPISRTVFPSTNVVEAFRSLSLTNCPGRVVIKMKDACVNDEDLLVLPRLEYNPEDVLIIVCDESYVGIDLADRLVQRGAKHLVIHLKTKHVSGYIHTKIACWRRQQVSLKLSSENLQTEHGCENLVKNAAKFGKVRGIFIVFDTKCTENINKNDFINTFNNKCLVVMNLELTSRNCKDLSEFTIITQSPQSLSDEYALSFIDKVSDTRNEMGLLTLVLRYQIPLDSDGTKSKCDKTPPTSLLALFNSLEASLKLKQKNIIVFEMQEVCDDFQNKVLKILGIKDINCTDSDILLEDLNLNITVLKELRNLILEKIQVDYPIKNILKMSAKRIIELSQEMNKEYNFDNCISTFIEHVDKEEDHLTSDSIVEMTTLTSNSTEFNDSNLGSDFVIMIPGFEGRPDIFTSVAERLKIPALCVKLGPDMMGDSIYDISVEARKVLKKRYKIKSKFYLLGYSFGVNVCLELAKILESEGYSGIVYCLDSSPEALKIQLDTFIGKLPEEEIQNKILYHMSYILTGTQDQILVNKLEETHDFEKKVETCLERMKNIVKYSKEYKRNLLELAYRRIMLAREYEPTFKLESELVLMKGTGFLNVEQLSEDYGLSKYTNQKVQVFQLATDHITAPQDCRVSNIVNQFLDETILKDFKTRHNCDVYSAD